jgi:hypothetical protein
MTPLNRVILAHGLDVVATDPAPGSEEKLRHYVEAAWPALTKIGLAPGASTARLRFESDLHEALAGAQMVQENAPEREQQFAGPMKAWWADLGSPDLGPELQKKIVDGVLEEVDGRSIEALSKERDTLIIGLLELLSHRGNVDPLGACGHTADDL